MVEIEIERPTAGNVSKTVRAVPSSLHADLMVLYAKLHALSTGLLYLPCSILHEQAELCAGQADHEDHRDGDNL